MKRLVQIALAVGIAAGFLAYALWEVDLVALATILRAADYGYLLPYQLVLIAFFVLKAWRWAYLLKPVGAFSSTDVAPAMLIGFAGNNLLPARLGEILRILAFARARDRSLIAVGASVALERLLDMVAMLALFLVVLPMLGEVDDQMRGGLYAIAALVALALGMVLGMVWWPHVVLGLWDKLGRWLPARVHAIGNHALTNAIGALDTARSPSRLAVAFANSLLQWCLASALVWLSLRAVGVALGPEVAVLALLTTGIAAAAPNAPGFVGAVQAAFVFALVPFAVAPEEAVAASVVYLLGQWIPVTAVGLVCLVHHARRFESLADAFLPRRASV